MLLHNAKNVVETVKSQSLQTRNQRFEPASDEHVAQGPKEFISAKVARLHQQRVVFLRRGDVSGGIISIGSAHFSDDHLFVDDQACQPYYTDGHKRADVVDHYGRYTRKK